MKIKTEAFRAERLAQGHSQRSIADRAGMSKATIQSVENGEPKRVSTIRRLAAALGCPISDIAASETSEEALALERQAHRAEAS